MGERGKAREMGGKEREGRESGGEPGGKGGRVGEREKPGGKGGKGEIVLLMKSHSTVSTWKELRVQELTCTG